MESRCRTTWKNVLIPIYEYTYIRKQLRILWNKLLDYFNSMPNVLRVIGRSNLRWARYERCLRRGAQYIKYCSENIKSTRERLL